LVLVLVLVDMSTNLLTTSYSTNEKVIITDGTVK